LALLNYAFGNHSAPHRAPTLPKDKNRKGIDSPYPSGEVHLLSGFPVVGQQIFCGLDGVILGSVKDIGEVFQRIDVANFARSQDGVKDSGSLS